jgi:hypothetical protein
MNQSGSTPLPGLRARGNRGALGRSVPFLGDERLQDRALWGIRVGTASTKQRPRPMWRLCPAPGVNDVNAHRD